MAKKTCPNGHIYDPNIYGDQCPLCPASVSAPIGSGPETHLGTPPTPPPMGGGFGASAPAAGAGLHTHIAGAGQPGGAPGRANDAAGATSVRPKDAEPKGAPAGGHTVIRHAGKQMPGVKAPSRKLVGFLVTYNRDPNGKAFNIYEGRNFLGRDAGCDISIPDDDQISSRHMSILFRNVDKKFKFRDEQSSNGTFVNGELQDDGELENQDIIRVGNTLFVFVAIPDVF